MNNSENLRQILGSKSILKIGGAFDAMSAKLVETHGFDAIWAGSFAISAALFKFCFKEIGGKSSFFTRF